MGRSEKLEKRWKEHQQQLTAKKHDNPMMQALADTYGVESFTFEVLETCTRRSVGKVEYDWIAKLQPTLNRTYTEKAKVEWNAKRWTPERRAKHTELMRSIAALRKTEPEFRRQQAIAAAIEEAIAALEKHEEYITPRQRQQLRQIAGEDEL